MKKEVIIVPNGEKLVEEIPKILEIAKNKEIYLDVELTKQLKRKFSTVFAGKYNLFVESEFDGFNRVVLIRIKLRAYYKKPEKTEGIILILTK